MQFCEKLCVPCTLLACKCFLQMRQRPILEVNEVREEVQELRASDMSCVDVNLRAWDCLLQPELGTCGIFHFKIMKNGIFCMFYRMTDWVLVFYQPGPEIAYFCNQTLQEVTFEPHCRTANPKCPALASTFSTFTAQLHRAAPAAAPHLRELIDVNKSSCWATLQCSSDVVANVWE